jgi:hypothetical protein
MGFWGVGLMGREMRFGMLMLLLISIGISILSLRRILFRKMVVILMYSLYERR